MHWRLKPGETHWSRSHISSAKRICSTHYRIEPACLSSPPPITYYCGQHNDAGETLYSNNTDTDTQTHSTHPTRTSAGRLSLIPLWVFGVHALDDNGALLQCVSRIAAKLYHCTHTVVVVTAGEVAILDKRLIAMPWCESWKHTDTQQIQTLQCWEIWQNFCVEIVQIWKLKISVPFLY